MLVADLADDGLAEGGVGARHDQRVAVGLGVLLELDSLLGAQHAAVGLPGHSDLGLGLDEGLEAGLGVSEHSLAAGFLNELGQQVFFFSYFLFGFFV